MEIVLTPRNKTATQAMAAAIIISTSWTASQAQAAEGDFVVIGHFYPVAGSEPEFESFFRKASAYVHKAEPEVVYRLHRTTKEPVVFVWYESYPSKEAFDNHRKNTLPAFEKEAGSFPKEKLAKPPEIEILQLLSGG